MKTSRAVSLAVAGILCMGWSASGDVLVNFNNTNDLANLFNNNNAAGTVNVASGGLGDSGAVDYNNTGQVFAYNQESFDLSLGAHTISMYLKIQGNGSGNTENFWLGFTTDVTNDYRNAAGGTSASDEFYLYVQEGNVADADSYTLNLKEGNQRPASTSAATLTDGNWYYLTMTAARVDANSISTTLGMFNSDANGVVGSSVLSIGATEFDSASASDTTLYAFFGGVTMQNNGSSLGDNFAVTVIPEPASLALFGAGVGLLGWVRRFRRH